MEQRIFMMGEFEATFPIDRQYNRNHMWSQRQPSGRLRFGFSAYAVRLLQDVYFLDWSIEAPLLITAGQEIGSIESKKAESSLYSAMSGNLVCFNDVLMEDPSAINVDKYGAGWLFEMDQLSLTDATEPLEADGYLELLVSVWKKTQRTIKGQMND
jgi:glycine cleavage system H protein